MDAEQPGRKLCTAHHHPLFYLLSVKLEIIYINSCVFSASDPPPTQKKHENLSATWREGGWRGPISGWALRQSTKARCRRARNLRILAWRLWLRPGWDLVHRRSLPLSEPQFSHEYNTCAQGSHLRSPRPCRSLLPLELDHQPWKYSSNHQCLLASLCPRWDRNAEASLDTGLPGRPGSDSRHCCQGTSWSPLSSHVLILFMNMDKDSLSGGGGGQGRTPCFAGVLYYPLLLPAQSLLLLGDRLGTG